MVACVSAGVRYVRLERRPWPGLWFGKRNLDTQSRNTQHLVKAAEEMKVFFFFLLLLFSLILFESTFREQVCCLYEDKF